MVRPSAPQYGVLASNAAIVNSWHPVARSVEVGTSPHAITLLERQLVLWRTPSGQVFAAADRCPHREAPLSEGEVHDGCLVCPYHGWTFGDEGRCVKVPSANPGVPAPPKAHLQPFHSAERYGLVWVCLGTPRADIPTMHFDDDQTFRRINTPVEVWKSSATRMVDNFLDITHFPFVHVGTFGGAQDPTVPKVELRDLDDGYYGYSYEVLAKNTTGGTVASGQSGDVVSRSMSTGFILPFVARSTIRYETGLEHIIWMLSTPIDDVTSYFTFVIWRNDDFSVSAEEVIRFDMAIGAEDKRMLEKVPGLLTLDNTTLVSVQADKCNVEWRRRLIALMADADASDAASAEAAPIAHASPAAGT
jgi:phenylpropionate dioxygenase-like ring-hydroxylating dioxygenase large terminal subunit